MFQILFIILCSVILQKSNANNNFINNNNNSNNNLKNQCLLNKTSLINIDNNITKIDKISVGKSYNILLDKGQQKRLIFSLNSTSALFINFSTLPQGLIRRLYLNQTVNLTNEIRSGSKEIFFICASNGYYDLILICTQKKISFDLKISDKHPFSNWSFFNRSIPIKIRFQNRMQKRQLIIKWSKSQLDIHAIHYCLVVNTKKSFKNFCQAIQNESKNTSNNKNCELNNFYSSNQKLKQRERVKKIRMGEITVICTGSKSQQILKGLNPYTKYFIDVFGIHTKLKNLPFLLKSATVWFNRTHPNQLADDTMTLGKMTTSDSVSVFSFKIPNNQPSIHELNILILPCSGSQIDVKILKQRRKIQIIKDIYRPTYMTILNVEQGERYIIRIMPSTEDEVLRANKVGIAITTKSQFKNYPRLPTNTSLFEIRSVRNCRSTTIAWYSSPETRRFRYCVVVFHFSNSNKSTADHTNYCMDFGKRITNHSNFYRIRCFEPNQIQKTEYFPLLNLSPGESYLIYVTVNLLDGKSLPYEPLRINMNKNCYDDIENIYWTNNSFYDS